MKLTDEQIKSILVKDIKSKTILVSKDDLDKIIKEHTNRRKCIIGSVSDGIHERQPAYEN